MRFLLVSVLAIVAAGFAAQVSVTAPADWSAPVAGSDNSGWTIPLYEDRVDSAIDQNQPSAAVYMAGFSQGGLAQSFQQTNANINGAGIFLQPNVGGSDNVTIQLWTNLPNAGGTMLAEASATGTAGNWVDVFWNFVVVTPATTYYLVFTGNSSLGIAGDTNNPYPYGMVYANAGYTPFANFDYTFRTYYQLDVSLERTTWAGVKAVF